MAQLSKVITLNSENGADRAFLNCVRADPAHDWLGDTRSRTMFNLSSVYDILKKWFFKNPKLGFFKSLSGNRTSVLPNLVLASVEDFSSSSSGGGRNLRNRPSTRELGTERRQADSKQYRDYIRSEKLHKLRAEKPAEEDVDILNEEEQEMLSKADVDMLRMTLGDRVESGKSTLIRIQNKTWIGRRSFGSIAKKGSIKAEPDFIIYFDVERAIAAATGVNADPYDPGWLVVNDEVISPFDVEYCGKMRHSDTSNAFGQCGGAKTQRGGYLPDSYYKFKITNGSYKHGVISVYDNKAGLVFVPPPTPITTNVIQEDPETGDTVALQFDPSSHETFTVPYDQSTDTIVFILDSLSIYRDYIGDTQVNQAIQNVNNLLSEQLIDSDVFFQIITNQPYGLYMYLCLFTGLLDIPMVQYLTAANADDSGPSSLGSFGGPPQVPVPIENEFAVLFPTLCTKPGLLNTKIKIEANFEQLLLNELFRLLNGTSSDNYYINILYEQAFLSCYLQNPPLLISSAFISGLAMFYSVRTTNLPNMDFVNKNYLSHSLQYKLAVAIVSLGEEEERDDAVDFIGLQPRQAAEGTFQHPPYSGQAAEMEVDEHDSWLYGSKVSGQRGGGSGDDPHTDMKVANLVLLLVASINYAQKQLPNLGQEDLFDGTGTDSVSLSDVIGSKLAVSEDYSNPNIAGNSAALSGLETRGIFTDTSKGALEKNMVKAVCIALSDRASTAIQPNTQIVWSGKAGIQPSATEEDLFLDKGLPLDQYRLFDIIKRMTENQEVFNQELQEKKRFMITNAWSKPDEKGLKKKIPSDFFIDNSFYIQKQEGSKEKEMPMFFCPTSSVMDPQSTCSTLNNAKQSGYEYGIQDVTVQSEPDQSGKINIVMRTRMETISNPTISDPTDDDNLKNIEVSFYLKVGDYVLSNYASESAKAISDWPTEPAPHPPLTNDITQVPQTVKGRGEAKRHSIIKKIDTSSPMDAQTAFYFLMKFIDVVNIYPYSIDGVIIQNGQPPFTVVDASGSRVEQRASLGALCWLVKTKPDNFRLKINTQSIIKKGYNQAGGRFAHWFTDNVDEQGEYIFYIRDLRRGIVEYGLRKFLGDYCQTLTSVARNGGYLPDQRFTNELGMPAGQTILDPDQGRLGLHNDQPATAVALLLTMLGQGDVNSKTVNGSYFGGVKKKTRPFVKYVIASRWKEEDTETDITETMEMGGGKKNKNKKKTKKVKKKQKKRYTRNKNGKNKSQKKSRKPQRSSPKPRKTRRRRNCKAK